MKLRSERKNCGGVAQLGYYWFAKSKNLQVSLLHDTDSNTTARLQLSNPVLVSFQMPPGTTLSPLVLVVGNASYWPAPGQVKRPDANDAAQRPLLDRPTIRSGRVLGRFRADR